VFNFGIESYRPRWLTGRNAVMAAQGERLRALIGRTLTRSWPVWDLQERTSQDFAEALAVVAVEFLLMMALIGLPAAPAIRQTRGLRSAVGGRREWGEPP
jgi:hypothetical protein